MPIYFDELETILNQWKMHSFTWRGDTNNKYELKKRSIAKIIQLFEAIDYDNIDITEEAKLNREHGKITYDNIVRISMPHSKL